MPENELGLITFGNTGMCLEYESSNVVTVKCNLYNKNQWWWGKKEAASHQLIHFDSQKCLSYQNVDNTFHLETDCSVEPTNHQEFSMIISNHCTASCDNLFKILKQEKKSSSFTLRSSLRGELLSDTITQVTANENRDTGEITFHLKNQDASSTITLVVNLSSGSDMITALSFQSGTYTCSLSMHRALPDDIPEDIQVNDIPCNTQIGDGLIALDVKINISQLESAFPDDFSIIRQDDDGIVTGIFGAQSGEKIIDFIFQNSDVKRLIFQDAPGSANDNALQYYGPFIRAYGYETYIPSDGFAASGGVDLFLAGVKRTVERGAIFGVHSWSGPGRAGFELPMDHPDHDGYIEYANALLGSPVGRDFYFFTLSGGTALCQMTEVQLRRHKVATDIIGASPSSARRFTDLLFCVDPYDYRDDDQDGWTNATETYTGTDLTDSNSYPDSKQIQTTEITLNSGNSTWQLAGLFGSKTLLADEHRSPIYGSDTPQVLQYSGQSFPVSRQLFLKFDLSTLSSDKTVIDAQLRIRWTQEGHNPGEIPALTIGRVSDAWDTSGSNYALFNAAVSGEFAFESFTSVGFITRELNKSRGKFELVFPNAYVSEKRLKSRYKYIDVTQFVRSWQQGTHANHGMRIWYNPSGYTRIIKFKEDGIKLIVLQSEL